MTDQDHAQITSCLNLYAETHMNLGTPFFRNGGRTSDFAQLCDIIKQMIFQNKVKYYDMRRIADIYPMLLIYYADHLNIKPDRLLKDLHGKPNAVEGLLQTIKIMNDETKET